MDSVEPKWIRIRAWKPGVAPEPSPFPPLDDAERRARPRDIRRRFAVGNAHWRTTIHREARLRIVALLSSRSHAELAYDPATVQQWTVDEACEYLFAQMPQLDVTTLVAAPSAPPRVLAHISTSEASV